MVGVKLLVLAFFIVVAFVAAFNIDNLSPFAPEGVDGVVDAAAIIFFAYIGFDAVSTGGEEAQEPERDLPLAIVGSLVICTVLLHPRRDRRGRLARRRGARGVRRAAGRRRSTRAPASPGRRALMAFGALVAITSVMLTIFYGQTRIFFAMAATA